MFFVHPGTENQLNILFVYIVADDDINYLREFIMLYSKQDRILIHNLHILKAKMLKINYRFSTKVMAFAQSELSS